VMEAADWDHGRTPRRASRSATGANAS
jgi:hypothetical protein